LLAETAGIERSEMYRAFNCGVGMIIALPADQAEKAISVLKDHDVNAFAIGSIEAGEGSEPVIIK